VSLSHSRRRSFPQTVGSPNTSSRSWGPSVRRRRCSNPFEGDTATNEGGVEVDFAGPAPRAGLRIRVRVTDMSTTCAHGTCNEQPVDGSTFCYRHVPIADQDGLPASVCPRCGKTVTPAAWVMHPRYCRGRAAEKVESGGEPVTAEPSPRPLRPSQQSMTIACAVGPCDNQRVSGTPYCAKHGPMTGRNAPRSSRTSKSARG
jgi:hypothetical protein